MRIGIDARFYGSLGKGLGRYTEKLIEHLEACDTVNEYVIFLRRENFEEYVPGNNRFTKVLAHYTWYGFGEQLFYPFVLYRERLEIVHFPHFNVPLLYRRRFVLTVHDLILLHYPTLRNTTRSAWVYRLKFLAYRWTIASAVRRAEAVITVSRFTEADLLKQYPFVEGKVSVTYEAADGFCLWSSNEEARVCLSRLGLMRKHVRGGGGAVSHDILKPYFLYVGNAYPHKNLELLVETAKYFPDYLFVIVGKEDYFYKRLKEKTQKSGAENVIFSGFASDRELGVLYRHAMLYCFPSLYEGFGLPPLEAMNYGLPVVSSNRAALPEILGSAAAFFEPAEARAFRQVLEALLAQAEERDRLRQEGYRRIKLFSWRTMAQETRRVYQAVQNKKKYVSGQASEHE